jgi:hypothetical protein
MGWLTFLVVRPSRGGVNESTGDSRDEESVGNSELDGVVQRSLGLSQHGIELGSLGHSSGESIKDETSSQPNGLHLIHTEADSPVLALLIVGQLVLDHVDHDLIADEVSSVHDLLGLFTEVSLSLNLGSKHVSSSQVAYTVFARNVGCLCSLPYIISR